MPKQSGIQLLRATAAIMVLIGHVLAEAEHYFGVTIPLTRLPWTRGVDIFFVISGFIITLSAQRLWDQPHAARRFLWRRFLRVVPLYYLFTTLMIVAVVIVPGGAKDTVFDPAQILSSYLFWPYERYDGRIAPVLSLGWTLNYEMFFYLLFAGALLLTRRTGLFVLFGAILLLSVVGMIFQPTLPAVAFWTNPIIMAFGFGVLIALGYLNGLGPKRGSAIVLGLGFAALIAMNIAPNLVPRFIASGLPAAIIVAAPVLFSTQVSAPRLGLLLGDASYALYLSHRFVLRAATLLMLSVFPMTTTGAYWFSVFVCCVALVASVAVFRWVEQPLLAKLGTAR
jgi:exopolysaccharide production protein ExoZ